MNLKRRKIVAFLVIQIADECLWIPPPPSPTHTPSHPTETAQASGTRSAPKAGAQAGLEAEATRMYTTPMRKSTTPSAQLTYTGLSIGLITAHEEISFVAKRMG